MGGKTGRQIPVFPLFFGASRCLNPTQNHHRSDPIMAKLRRCQLRKIYLFGSCAGRLPGAYRSGSVAVDIARHICRPAPTGNQPMDNPMNKFVAFAFASAAMISTAFAGEIEGVVVAVDPAAATVELESGEIFTVVEGVALDGVEAGKTVMIMFEDDTTNATEIAIVE
jgi:hypothetical protein